jgi:hypothetical protein
MLFMRPSISVKSGEVIVAGSEDLEQILDEKYCWVALFVCFDY